MRARYALQLVFWICPLALQPLIALAIVVRRRVRDFPLFLSYTLFVSGRDFALLFLRRNLSLYSWIYWLGEPVAILLALASIYEVLWYLIRPYPTLRLLGRRLFGITLVVAVVAGMMLLKTSPFNRISTSIESARLLERSAWFVEVGVLIAFIFFISHLGVTWKHYAAGIIAGFGIAAGLQLAFVELESLHVIGGNIFVLLKSAAYNCAVLIWAAYFLRPQEQTPAPKELPETDLAKWDELLRRYLQK